MFHNAILIIDHHNPVESILYSNLFTDIESKIRLAQRAYLLNKINTNDGEVKLFYEKALSIFDDDDLSWLWIEKTEPGSCKCEGKGRNRILYALLGALGFFAADVVDETKIYKDAKDATIYAADLGYDYLKEFVSGTEEYDIEIEKDGNTIKFTIRIDPFIEEKYLRLSEPPKTNG